MTVRKKFLFGFCAVLMALGLAPAVASSAGAGPASGDVLVYGDRSERDATAGVLSGLGYNVTNEVALPADLSAFDAVFHIGIAPIAADEQTRLADFVSAGGGLYITGERPCCEALNDTVETLVNGLVAGGGITIGDQGDQGTEATFNATAVGGTTTTPNTLTTWTPAASGGIAGVSGANVLAVSNGDGITPVAAAWDASSMATGVGRVVVMMDVNYHSDGSAETTDVLSNMATFLVATPDPLPDRDDDGIPDDDDNCPDDQNEDQQDTDEDGEGDVCDETPDGTTTTSEATTTSESTTTSSTAVPDADVGVSPAAQPVTAAPTFTG